MSTMSNLEVIKNRSYGTHKCSCGCGKILGSPFVTNNPYYAYGIGSEDDEEGYDWRMFTPECWENIKANYDITSQNDLSLIYNSYSASEEV